MTPLLHSNSYNKFRLQCTPILLPLSPCAAVLLLLAWYRRRLIDTIILIFSYDVAHCAATADAMSLLSHDAVAIVLQNRAAFPVATGWSLNFNFLLCCCGHCHRSLCYHCIHADCYHAAQNTCFCHRRSIVAFQILFMCLLSWCCLAYSAATDFRQPMLLLLFLHQWIVAAFLTASCFCCRQLIVAFANFYFNVAASAIFTLTCPHGCHCFYQQQMLFLLLLPPVDCCHCCLLLSRLVGCCHCCLSEIIHLAVAAAATTACPVANMAITQSVSTGWCCCFLWTPVACCDFASCCCCFWLPPAACCHFSDRQLLLLLLSPLIYCCFGCSPFDFSSFECIHFAFAVAVTTDYDFAHTTVPAFVSCFL